MRKCTAWWPTAPAPPATRTRCAATPPWVSTACAAVSAGIPWHAPTSPATLSGKATACCCGRRRSPLLSHWVEPGYVPYPGPLADSRGIAFGTDGVNAAHAIAVRNDPRKRHRRATRAGPSFHIGSVDAAQLQPDSHLGGCGLRVRQVTHNEHTLGGPGLLEVGRFHLDLPFHFSADAKRGTVVLACALSCFHSVKCNSICLLCCAVGNTSSASMSDQTSDSGKAGDAWASKC